MVDRSQSDEIRRMLPSMMAFHSVFMNGLWQAPKLQESINVIHRAWDCVQHAHRPVFAQSSDPVDNVALPPWWHCMKSLVPERPYIPLRDNRTVCIQLVSNIAFCSEI